MSFSPEQQGLQLDQAPPLALPTSFFLTVPVAMVAGGALLLRAGAGALTNHWLAETAALTHVGTLGVVGMAMLGALYQMAPVVAGAPVPWARLGHAVHALLVAGITALTIAFWGGPTGLFGAAGGLLGAALLLFLVPTTWALWRAPTRSHTVTGMRLALASLWAVASLGVWMATQHAAQHFQGDRSLWMGTHLVLALLGWVGGLLSAVSWQVVPMFYLAPPLTKRQQVGVLALLTLGLGATAARATLWPDILPGPWAWLVGLPAAVAVWGLQPLWLWRSLAARRRPRTDVSLWFWRLSLAVAPLVAVSAGVSLFSADPRWPIALGWLAIWGWAGTAVHGMLTRILPFLVWFHRFSKHVGLRPVPPMNRLLPERSARAGLYLHAGCLALGLLAIVTGSDTAARLCGTTLVGTGLCLGYGLLQVVGARLVAGPPPDP